MRLLFLLLLTTTLSAQPNLQWRHRYDGTSHIGDRAAKVSYDHSGNLIVTGYVHNRCTGEDIYTAKYDASGNRLWFAVYTGFNAKDDDEDRPTDLVIDAQNNIIITGYSDSINTSYMSTVKYSPSGTELWSRRHKINESYGSSLSVDDSGNVYVAGHRTISFDDDVLLIKYSPAGTILWTQTHNIGSEDMAMDVEADNNGNVYVTGHAFIAGQSYDYLTIKYTSGGAFQWANTYNGSAGNFADRAVKLSLDPSLNVTVTGTARHFANSDDDIVTIRYSPSGSTLYTAPWSGSPHVMDDYAQDIVCDNNGNAYVLGGTYTPTFGLDLVLMKIDPAGTISWANVTDSLNDTNYPWALAIDNNNQYLYTASDFTHGPDPYIDRDWLLQKTDLNGNEVSRITWDGTGNNFDIPFGIDVNATGDIALSGVSAPSLYDTDFGTVVFNSQLTQQWEKYENGQSFVDDIGHDLYVDPAGNSYACGSFFNYYYNESVVVFKVNTSGQRVWTYEWEGPKLEGSEIATALAVDAASNTYVTGTIDTSAALTDQDIFLFKLDPNGQLLWRTIYTGPANGDDYPVGLRLKNGKLYIAGNTVNTTTGADGLALCYDINGVQQWATSYDGGGSGEFFMDMEIDAQQNLFAAGQLNPLTSQADGLIVKFNNQGTILWDSTYNNPASSSSFDFFNCITVDSMGNAFAAGMSSSNWMTCKYTTAGIREWSQHYSYSSNKDSVCDIAVDRNNDVIVGGEFGQFSSQDFGLIKYRNDSTQVWVKKYNNSAGSDDRLIQILIDDTNNIYATGWETSSFTTNYQMMVVKYDSAGTFENELIWTDSLGNAPDYGKKIAFDSNANLYLMGNSSDHCFGNTFFNGFRWDIQINKYGFSSGVGINEQSAQPNAALLAYPNPAKGLLNIRFNESHFTKGTIDYKIYDISGKSVFEGQTYGTETLQLNTTVISPGMYLIVVIQGNQRQSVKVYIE